MSSDFSPPPRVPASPRRSDPASPPLPISVSPRPRVSASSPPGIRQVAHLNIRDFYATLEELRHPELRKGPLALAEAKERAVVQGVNAIARSEGIREGMSLGQARRLCRRIRTLAPDPGFYRECHEQLVQRFSRFSPLVEGPFPGRYFVDLTGTRRLWGPSPDVASAMERGLMDETGLQARVGLAASKLVSQVASNCIHPGDLSCIFPGWETAFLAPLPVSSLPGVGAKTALHLADLNLVHIGQLASLPAGALTGVFGKPGLRLLRMARGIDPTPVVSFQQVPRMNLVRRLDRDEIDRDRLESLLFQQVEEVGWELRCLNRYPGRLALEIRYADGGTARLERTLEPITAQVDQRLFQAVRPVFRQVFQRRVAIRRMVLELSDFTMPARQLALFPWEEARFAGERKLQEALDAIRRRFGRDAISWGRGLGGDMGKGRAIFNQINKDGQDRQDSCNSGMEIQNG
jgi:DNA polymerase-4